MRNRRTLRFAALGWIVVMIASCSYGRDQVMPSGSPTASAQVTEKRARAVDATATAQPLTPTPTLQPPQPSPLGQAMLTATIGGGLCYPSERIPPMIVYARNVDTGETYMTQVERGQLEYTITVPAPANYILFAWTTGDPFSSSRPFTTSDSFGGIYSCAGDFLGQTGRYPKISPHWETAQWKCYGRNTPVPLEDHTPIIVRVRPGERITDAFICDFYADKSAVPKPGSPNPPGMRPPILPRGQVTPDLTSVIRYATIEAQPTSGAYYPRYSHLQLRLGADGKVAGAPQPVELPANLGFSPYEVWPSPTGDYTVLMRPVEPGGVPYIWNRKTGKTESVLSQYGGGNFYGWHPDGRRFLFWIDSVGIWLIDAETQAKVMLANPNSPVQDAAILPDGKTVAFVADGPPGVSRPTLWLVSTGGGDAKPQTDIGGVSYLSPHAWSPDGNRLIDPGCAPPVSKGTPPPLYPACILDLRTRARLPLRIPYGGSERNWSPDGRFIAARSLALNEAACTNSEWLASDMDTCMYKGRSIYAADTTTGLVEEIGAGTSPVWSPDSSMIAFLSNRSGASEIWLYNRVTRESKQLTADGQRKSPYGQLVWRSR